MTVDNCPERMHAVDAEAPRPPQIETAVGFGSGMALEAVLALEAVEALEAVVDAL